MQLVTDAAVDRAIEAWNETYQAGPELSFEELMRASLEAVAYDIAAQHSGLRVFRDAALGHAVALANDGYLDHGPPAVVRAASIFEHYLWEGNPDG